MKDQQSLQNLRKEVIVIEYMIQQMHQCLEIFHEGKLSDDFNETLKDIERFKKEKKRLIQEIDKIIDFNQGEPSDVAFKCRKTFS
jgi:hypothetical protein